MSMQRWIVKSYPRRKIWASKSIRFEKQWLGKKNLHEICKKFLLCIVLDSCEVSQLP